MLRSLGASAPVVLVAEKPVVLVVEENAIFRAATAKRLRSAGFEVFEATNSAEAEPVLKNTPIDAVVDIPINQWLRAGRNRSVPATPVSARYRRA
jgi:DNA-binding response OmpR family regulator